MTTTINDAVAGLLALAQQLSCGWDRPEHHRRMEALSQEDLGLAVDFAHEIAQDARDLGEWLALIDDGIRHGDDRPPGVRESEGRPALPSPLRDGTDEKPPRARRR